MCSSDLINIVSNAFKYTPDHGEIDILLSIGHDSSRADALTDYIEIAVQDTGIGIEKDKIERIFECFYRIDNQMTHRNNGTGIGLYLSQLLVKLHQGQITAFNRTDRGGSRFVVRIPQGISHVASVLETREAITVTNKTKYNDPSVEIGRAHV